MTVKEKKLINDVGHVLKALYEVDGDDFRNVKVDYKIFDDKALIHWPQKVIRTGNGYERYYDWDLIDKLKDVTDKYGISYKIGLTDSLDFHILIYEV